jgi:hypothetical protein
MATPAITPITIPAIAPPDNAVPAEEEEDEEGDTVAVAVVGV